MVSPSAETLIPGSEILVGVIKFSFSASTIVSAVQEDIKIIAAKQPVAINSFFIKKMFKKFRICCER